MKRLTKRTFSLLLTVCVAVVSLAALMPTAGASSAGAGYVALGDSIATGYGLEGYAPGVTPEDSYSALVAQGIQADSFVNFAADGLASGGLLAALQTAQPGTPAYIALSAAEVVTVSIGSNDILGPFLALVADTLNCTVAVLPQTLYELSLDPVQWLAAVQSLQAALASDATISAGIVSFTTNFPAVITAIKAIAPDTAIYVTNAYNPYTGVVLGTEPMTLDLGAVTEPYIQALNQVIAAAAISGGFVAVDVASAFAQSDAPVVNANLQALNFDPHPNAAGHALIAELVLLAAAP